MLLGAAPPCILDVEASGFGPMSYPIEVGLALDDGRKYCTLVIPAPHWTHWDEEAEKIHRVPRDILEEYGKPIEQVVSELNDLLSGKTIYTDGWVVDNTWMIKLYEEGRKSSRFSISALEMILTESQMNNWHDTKDLVVSELNLQRHRASYDAMIVQETWVRTRAMQDQPVVRR